MNFIPFIHEQICYEIIFFVFYLISFGISRMSIPFQSYQMVEEIYGINGFNHSSHSILKY